MAGISKEFLSPAHMLLSFNATKHQNFNYETVFLLGCGVVVGWVAGPLLLQCCAQCLKNDFPSLSVYLFICF